MIKLIDANIDFTVIEKKHNDTFKLKVMTILDNISKSKKINSIEKQFVLYLKDQVFADNILTGKPDQLRTVREHYLNDYKGRIKFSFKKKKKKQYTYLGKKINEAFNYGQFSRTYISEGWGAYEFTKLLGVKTCMYCNRNYTVTFDRSLNSSNVKGKIRPVLDHLFEKAKYPFFGISIYNLVPSCYECNSGLKGVIANEAQEDHLNPYEDGFHDIFHFVDIPAVRNPMHSRDNFDFIAESTYYDIEWENFDNESYDIKILQRKGCKASNDIVSRATINKELFALEELYNEHKEFISPIIFSCSKYGINIFDHLKETFPSFNFTREQWEQLYFGSFIGDKNNFIKRPFSKLIYDIASNYRVI